MKSNQPLKSAKNANPVCPKCGSDARKIFSPEGHPLVICSKCNRIYLQVATKGKVEA